MDLPPDALTKYETRTGLQTLARHRADTIPHVVSYLSRGTILYWSHAIKQRGTTLLKGRSCRDSGMSINKKVKTAWTATIGGVALPLN